MNIKSKLNNVSKTAEERETESLIQYWWIPLATRTSFIFEVRVSEYPLGGLFESHFKASCKIPASIWEALLWNVDICSAYWSSIKRKIHLEIHCCKKQSSIMGCEVSSVPEGSILLNAGQFSKKGANLHQSGWRSLPGLYQDTSFWNHGKRSVTVFLLLCPWTQFFF